MEPNQRPLAGESIDVVAALRQLASQNKVRNHPFLKSIKNLPMSKATVEVIIQQYWHPIHHFTEFLPRVIAVVNNIPMRTYVSRILWQELGEGNPERAHESLYLHTMSGAGFGASSIRDAPPLPATARLVAGYRKSITKPLSAVGFLYGTEVIDLAMVSAIGSAVRRVTGMHKLSWVDIHLEQEPDHVASVNDAATSLVSMEDQQEVIDSALEVWGLWNDFYGDIEQEIARLH